MNRLTRVFDDHYWTSRWIATGAFAFAVSLWLGGVR